MPRPLDEAIVDRMAALARLALTGDERARYGQQLADILAYAEEVQRVDTADVPPTSHVTAAGDSARDDERVPGLARDEVLANAPDADIGAGLFKVPRVIGS
jgi:aspartyl-tRNA(Asn)/glutamyl-tRNA(Gln) amidotransferase subunit C